MLLTVTSNEHPNLGAPLGGNIRERYLITTMVIGIVCLIECTIFFDIIPNRCSTIEELCIVVVYYIHMVESSSSSSYY